MNSIRTQGNLMEKIRKYIVLTYFALQTIIGYVIYSVVNTLEISRVSKEAQKCKIEFESSNFWKHSPGVILARPWSQKFRKIHRKIPVPDSLF